MGKHEPHPYFIQGEGLTLPTVYTLYTNFQNYPQLSLLYTKEKKDSIT